MIMQTSKAVLFSLAAMAGGLFLFQMIKRRDAAHPEGEARLDEMLEQSFPASDAPSY